MYFYRHFDQSKDMEKNICNLSHLGIPSFRGKLIKHTYVWLKGDRKLNVSVIYTEKKWNSKKPEDLQS